MRVAKKIVLSTKKTSASYLQRKMQIGYNYADMLMEDISKQRGFGFVYRYRRKLLGRSFRKKACRKISKQMRLKKSPDKQ